MITILVPSFICYRPSFFRPAAQLHVTNVSFFTLYLTHKKWNTISCYFLYLLWISSISKGKLANLNKQESKIIAKALYSLSFWGGQFLNKVLKVSIISKDFHLITTLIHKHSTTAVEEKVRNVEVQNQTFS